jgi:hypothetical protein
MRRLRAAEPARPVRPDVIAADVDDQTGRAGAIVTSAQSLLRSSATTRSARVLLDDQL